MRKTLWIIPILLAALSAPLALADTFTFSIDEVGGGPISGSGTITTDALSNGTYSITGITGTFDGSAITGLSTFDYADNLLYQGTNLPDMSGVAFALADGDSFNVFDLTQAYAWPDNSAVPLDTDSFAVQDTAQMIDGTFTPVTMDPNTSTPEPSSVALMLMGIGCLVVMRKRVARGFQLAA